MQTATTAGDRIRRTRRNLGLTQTELGELAGVVPSTISQIETGERQGHPATLKAIADALGCTVADITEAVKS